MLVTSEVSVPTGEEPDSRGRPRSRGRSALRTRKLRDETIRRRGSILFLTSLFAEIAENESAKRSNHVKRFWLLAVLAQFLAAGAFAELVTYKLSTPGVV